MHVCVWVIVNIITCYTILRHYIATQLFYMYRSLVKYTRSSLHQLIIFLQVHILIVLMINQYCCTITLLQVSAGNIIHNDDTINLSLETTECNGWYTARRLQQQLFCSCCTESPLCVCVCVSNLYPVRCVRFVGYISLLPHRPRLHGTALGGG